jgi:hypothetical protein
VNFDQRYDDCTVDFSTRVYRAEMPTGGIDTFGSKSRRRRSVADQARPRT